MNSLRDNAIASIKLGVEQYHESIKDSGSNAALGLSAIRNLYSGILLLIKAELSSLCPPESDEVLIKKDIRPVVKDGKLVFVGSGKKTIDADTAIEYCKSLGISLNAEALRSIGRERNKIEHYYPATSAQGLRLVLASACKLLHGFIRDNDLEDPAKIFGDTWRLLLQERELFEAEKRRCTEKLKEIAWKLEIIAESASSAQCPNCGAGLLEPAAVPDWEEVHGFRCVACSHQYETENFIELALADKYSASQYHSIAEGGEETIVTCPHCTRDCYLVDEEICAACDETCETECAQCGSEIPACEYSEDPYCSWCANMLSKD